MVIRPMMGRGQKWLRGRTSKDCCAPGQETDNMEHLLVVPVDADVTHNEEGGRSREKTVSQSQGCPECHAHEMGRKRRDRSGGTCLPTGAPGQREAKRLASSVGEQGDQQHACLDRPNDRGKTTCVPDGCRGRGAKEESPGSIPGQEVKDTSKKTIRRKGSVTLFRK